MQAILVIADPIDSEQLALNKALDFAAKSGAAIHLVCFCYDYLDVLTEDEAECDQLKHALIARTQRLFNEKIADIDQRNNETDIKIDVIWEKDITPWIVENTKKINYDLLIKTGHSGDDISKS